MLRWETVAVREWEIEPPLGSSPNERPLTVIYVELFDKCHGQGTCLKEGALPLRFARRGGDSYGERSG
jgi:hypothetical protein